MSSSAVSEAAVFDPRRPESIVEYKPELKRLEDEDPDVPGFIAMVLEPNVSMGGHGVLGRVISQPTGERRRFDGFSNSNNLVLNFGIAYELFARDYRFLLGNSVAGVRLDKFQDSINS